MTPARRPAASPSTRKAAPSPATDASAESQLASFVAKFDPQAAALIVDVRRELRARLPTAMELVYDNYQFLAIGFCTTDRTSSCFLSIAAGANGVSLSFYNGATLPDPSGILLGEGKQNRFVRLPSVATLSDPAVGALIAAAVAQATPPLPATERGTTIIKSISAKQRPRRK